MNISYNWLKDLVEIDLSPQELAEKLTRAGLAVEGVNEEGDDFVMDLDLTSNRPDCLSHLGIAREMGAITNRELRITNDELPTTNDGGETAAAAPEGDRNLVTIQDADLCHRFTARVIRNVKIAPSPDWLVKRLEAIGERAINNVADITNYVMHELGQPMHSFDLKKLAENRIVVRRARAGETIKTLDEAERKLDETMLAICDAEKPVAVAGVMGGFDSGISDETTDVLLEVAYFDRDSIRRTSRRLKLSTEASHRFERGVDIENLVRASNRATELICELAGGEAGEFVDVYPTKYSPKEIQSPDIQNAVKRLTGLGVEGPEILRILNSLGIKTKEQSPTAGGQSQVFVSPSWRHDIAIEEDLVEEVARVVGYDRIGEELPASQSAGEYQPAEPRKRQMRKTLADLGFDEAISYSFIDTRYDDTFGLLPGLVHEKLEEKFVTLQDSIIEGSVRMRPSLLPGLLAALRTNFNHQRRDVKLFEIGKVFAASPKENDLPEERELFSVALSGAELQENKAAPVRELDFYDAKGALEAAFDALNLPALEYRAAAGAKHLRKGQAAEVLLGGRPVGTVGRLSDEIAASYKFRQAVFVAEIDLQALLGGRQREVAYRPLPVLPSVVRDVSVLVGRNVSFADLRNVVLAQGFELVRRIEFVDVYEGKGVADDERSLTLRIEYRADERTLIEDEVDAVHGQILRALESATGAKLRG